MKETLILLITILFYCSCSSRNSESNTDKQLPKDSENIVPINNNFTRSYTGDSIPPTKIDGLRALSFKFNVDSSGYLLESINIYSENKLIQRIIANKEILHMEVYHNEFQLIDWDFDGFKDISVLHNCGSGGCAYWIWNYSSKENKYIYNKELSGYLGLEIDSTEQYIVFHFRAGYAQERWDSLKYENNKLLFVKGLFRERYNDSLGNFWVRNTFSKMKNNVVISKTDSFITEQEITR
jgi:hypothetical protein